MDRSFPLMIKVINGEVQEFPVQFYFRCDQLKPSGPTIYRYFDDAMCSVAIRVFNLNYNGELFGSTQFKTNEEFWRYWGAVCNGPQKIMLLLNGCNMVINGKKVAIL